jgi:hypothetical protein
MQEDRTNRPQGCGLRLGLRVTRARPLGHVFGCYGMCNDDPHSPSRTKLVESALLAVEIRRRIRLEHTVPFEKAIDLVEDLDQHTLQLGLTQMSGWPAPLRQKSGLSACGIGWRFSLK